MNLSKIKNCYQYFLTAFLGAFVIASAATVILWCQGYRLNFSASLPPGLWKILPRSEIQRGDYVIFKADWDSVGIERNYHLPTVSLMKKVFGVPGDLVDKDSAGQYYVNGRKIPNAFFKQQDAKGKETPKQFIYPYVLADNQYFCLGEHPLSWDSRYFGPVERKYISNKAAPVWVKKVEYF